MISDLFSRLLCKALPAPLPRSIVIQFKKLPAEVAFVVYAYRKSHPDERQAGMGCNQAMGFLDAEILAQRGEALAQRGSAVI